MKKSSVCTRGNVVRIGCRVEFPGVIMGGRWWRVGPGFDGRPSSFKCDADNGGSRGASQREPVAAKVGVGTLMDTIMVRFRGERGGVNKVVVPHSEHWMSKTLK